MRYLVGNWKMNPPSREEAVQLTRHIVESLQPLRDTTIVLCPPFIWLEAVSSTLRTYGIVNKERGKNGIALGAQDVYYAETGTFTGQISPLMLRDLGVAYALIGHSERRIHANEDDPLINKKIHACLEHDITPILLVGDEDSLSYHGLSDEASERTRELEAIATHLERDLEDVPGDRLHDILFVYEPVWAISTGTATNNKAASPEFVTSRIEDMKTILQDIFEGSSADTTHCTYLYGGSSNQDNLASLMEQPRIQGVVAGGASLRPNEFVRMTSIMQTTTAS